MFLTCKKHYSCTVQAKLQVFHEFSRCRRFQAFLGGSIAFLVVFGGLWVGSALALQTEILSYLMLLSINGGKVASILSSTSLEDGQRMHTLGSRLQRCHEASWHLLWEKLCCMIMPEEQAPWQTLALQAC